MKFRSSLDKYRRGKPAQVLVKTHTVVVDALSNEGDGVARLNGQAVFIPHTAPGDKVVIEIVEQRKRWSRAKVVEILEASPNRVEPACIYVQRCGGCTWQHIDYATQLKIKQQQLIETLQRIGGLTHINTCDIISSAKPFHYRNRIRGVAHEGVFHFHGNRSEELIAIEQCAIASPIINQYLQYPDQPFAQVRESIELAETNDSTVKALSVDQERTTELGFRQVNSDVAEKLNEQVYSTIEKALCTETNALSLLDLYCGHGSWARRIASRQPRLRVVGVDVSEANIKIARGLAKNLKNASFVKNRSEKVLMQPDVNPDYIIVDPPRAGLSDTVVNALNSNPANLLIYISCHPASLARDLAKLHNVAYEIDSVQAFDMFPQTPHVETLVVLSKASITQ